MYVKLSDYEEFNKKIETRSDENLSSIAHLYNLHRIHLALQAQEEIDKQNLILMGHTEEPVPGTKQKDLP